MLMARTILHFHGEGPLYAQYVISRLRVQVRARALGFTCERPRTRIREHYGLRSALQAPQNMSDGRSPRLYSTDPQRQLLKLFEATSPNPSFEEWAPIGIWYMLGK